MAAHKHPFTCARCALHEPKDFKHFAPTDVWIMVYPKQQLIHIHFGSATANDKESTAETAFVYKHTTAWVEKHAPGIPFCGMIDLSRADDSELPSNETLELYKKMLSHEQNGLTIFYSMTPSMKFFVGMLKHLIKDGNRIRLYETIDEANAEYDKWLAEQVTAKN